MKSKKKLFLWLYIPLNKKLTGIVPTALWEA